MVIDATATTDVSPEKLTSYSTALAGQLERALREIGTVNHRTRLLSFNAQIEAARSGEAGAAFGVVAKEMLALSQQITEVASELRGQSAAAIRDLAEMNQKLSTSFRGMRLSDLALTNIDLIDRNLYERSCDVRWWATDPSLCRALQEATADARSYASHRLGVILDAYTVYFDLVLCDAQGRVVANGRPHHFHSVGSAQDAAPWFREAMRTQSGDEFGFHTVHASPLVNGERALVYSCAVRENGASRGEPLGVLGIVFRWDALAQTIVEHAPLSAEEKALSRLCIIDSEGTVLADTAKRLLQERISFPEFDELLRMPKGFVISRLGNEDCCIAHATSPGYETYATGWHSLIIQRLRASGNVS